jgi:hypothetical protein
MTNLAMRRREGDLQRELEDAEHHLQALCVRAQTHGEHLIALGVNLREHPETIWREGYSALHGFPVEKLRVIDDKTMASLEIHKVLDQASEIRKETANINRLKAALARIG